MWGCYIGLGAMALLAVYRRMPIYFAGAAAVLISAVIAGALAIAGSLALDFAFRKVGAQLDGLGAGVLFILVALNIAVGVFVAVISVLINLHHRTDWKTPTLAFVFCGVLIRVIGPFDIQFSPFLLGIGAVVCLACCWFLRRRGLEETANVL